MPLILVSFSIIIGQYSNEDKEIIINLKVNFKKK